MKHQHVTSPQTSLGFNLIYSIIIVKPRRTLYPPSFRISVLPKFRSFEAVGTASSCVEHIPERNGGRRANLVRDRDTAAQIARVKLL